ncbi:lactococcin 972 family bacteriocin [Aceticella autotrophica]|uniref:Lactococcin 972 family bacteriocin n=1 Tax=Aceticella autotrophica TaxID=2755338 RepID=A0A975AWB9_9THEO|nr:lactococcin 972 family bacteriocin [Aceticella autotrophica]QSZ27660.1 lactococcin 972 family bacteriocin [Aceticella autotrophica]
MFKKRFLSILLIVAMLTLLSGASAMAANIKAPTSGSVTLTNSQVTPFSVVSAGGGTWNYGTEINSGIKHVWSYYIHPSKRHSSTAIIGSSQDKEYAGAGVWSYADAFGAWNQTGYAYYHTY